MAGAALTLACAGTTAPRLDDLPVRSPASCALGAGLASALGGADVAIAIDTSHSTAWPSGVDVDGDGRTGRYRQSAVTDPGDSMLAAQVAAVRSLVRAALPDDARFSVVTYAGRTRFPTSEPPLRGVSSRDGAIRADMTGEIDALERAFERVLARGSGGNADFAAGLRLALRTLEEAPATAAPRRTVVLFLSDSPHPVVATASESQIQSTRRRAYPGDALYHAARRARRDRVAIHTFGLGEAAGATPPHALASLARVTGGTYRGVGDPGRLHCALLGALAR